MTYAQEDDTMNKIFENYFKQNLKEEYVDISTADDEANNIADIVVDEINTVFNQLPEDSTLKTREVALQVLNQIKINLPGMIQDLNIG